MSAGQRQWPGFHADGEPERMEQERQREREIKAENLSARIRADFQPDRIDRAIGRTFGECAERGLYDDDSRVRSFRDQRAGERDTRERYRWTQARLAGRAGRN